MLKLFGGLFMGWSLGANDAANIFGTGVASRLISFRNAVTLLSIFVIIGAVLEGSKCMTSLKDLSSVTIDQAFIATTAAAITMTLLTLFAIPASTSQAIVGAIIGVTWMHRTPNLGQLSKMVICWIGTPIGAAILGFVTYLIFNKFAEKYLNSSRHFQNYIRIAFIFTGCYGSYALGANNVANTTGVYVNAGMLTPQAGALIGGIMIALGAVTFSKKVMYSVGAKITMIGPIGALVATLAHSMTVHIYTQIGIPVSSSQAIVGAVIGIGMVRGIRAVNKAMIVRILIGWVMTPISAGLLAYLGSLLCC